MEHRSGPGHGDVPSPWLRRADVRALGLRLWAAGEPKCADTVSEAGVGGAVEAAPGEDSYRGAIKPECRPGAESAAAP